ncbi:MAG: 50S ribosomal protein L9 [Armatimonadota bacterium]
MKIILRSDVRDLGRAGELVEVKPGYARNYLLPRALAVPATDGNLRDYQKRIASAKEREERERASANELADKIRGKRVVMIRKPAEGSTRLHGSVTPAEVAEAVSALAGTTIDRRDVDLKQGIRALGEYNVSVKLMRGLTVPVQVLVAETEPVEEVPQAEAPAEEAAATPAEEAPAA